VSGGSWPRSKRHRQSRADCGLHRRCSGPRSRPGPYDEEWLRRRGVRLAALLAGVITFGGETHDKVGRGTRTRVRTAGEVLYRPGHGRRPFVTASESHGSRRRCARCAAIVQSRVHRRLSTARCGRSQAGAARPVTWRSSVAAPSGSTGPRAHRRTPPQGLQRLLR
jgi:hypothetical protein